MLQQPYGACTVRGEAAYARSTCVVYLEHRRWARTHNTDPETKLVSECHANQRTQDNQRHRDGQRGSVGEDGPKVPARFEVYFRLNVDQGLQDVKLSDWEQMGKVVADTRAYLSQTEVMDLLTRAAKATVEKQTSLSISHIGAPIS